ncbi:MAG: TaqI-like C-terminal specificity domain-containing protein, partial [Zestosphaera sp.]
DEVRRRYGAYDTPLHIVKFMVDVTGIKDFSGLRVPEPATGLAPFSRYIASLKGAWRDIYGVEVNPTIVSYLKTAYPEFNVIEGDYLLTDFGDKFDLVIGNPPYGIIGSENHYAISIFKNRKKIYKKRYKTWRGKYNIYGLFIEKGLKDLKEHGILTFIVPATWMILDEFKELRRFLSRNGEIEVYYLGRVFQGLNVVAVVLVVRKGGKGLKLYDVIAFKPRLIYSEENYDGGIITFRTPFTEAVEKLATTRLGNHYVIRISPRSPEIKSLIFVKREAEPGYTCILNGKNLTGANTIDYKTCYSGYYVKPEDVPRIREWFTMERVVVGHTKGGKLVVAVDRGVNGVWYAWMGDVYHLIPKESPPLSNDELARMLNSKVINNYVKQKYRDITPHTTKTQLEMLPLLRLEDLKALDSLRIP